jgi:hypothetical protein
LKISGLTHPKTKELAYSLEIPLPHAIGLLELLWAFVAQQTPRGNVGRWSNAVIAGEAGWLDDPDVFIKSLISCGFIDENDEHRLLVHDWKDHAPNWVHAKLKKTRRSIIRNDLSSDIRARQDTILSPTTSLATPSHSKTRQKRGPRKRGSRLSKKWLPDEKLIAWATDKRPDLNMKETIESFVDYWTSKTGTAATKLDWDATFRNWVRNERQRRGFTKLPLSDDELENYAAKHGLSSPRPGESSRQYRARLSDLIESGA